MLDDGDRVHPEQQLAIDAHRGGNFDFAMEVFKRLHEEAEQASVYVPVQSCLTDRLQSYQMLRWLEGTLEPILVHGPGRDGKLYGTTAQQGTGADGAGTNAGCVAFRVSPPFTLSNDLYVTVTGTGGGNVMSAPAGISCSSSGTPRTMPRRNTR